MEYLELDTLSDEVYDFLLEGDLDFELEFEPEPDCLLQQPLDYAVEEVEVSEQQMKKLRMSWLHRVG